MISIIVFLYLILMVFLIALLILMGVSIKLWVLLIMMIASLLPIRLNLLANQLSRVLFWLVAQKISPAQVIATILTHQTLNPIILMLNSRLLM
ncbi:hypothetical protein ATT74_07675 [Salmonella enterica subsp. enterica serovar Panama]|nr:hypothetical protein [Salmonella enterica subsp. enterica serovar Panama]